MDAVVRALMKFEDNIHKTQKKDGFLNSILPAPQIDCMLQYQLFHSLTLELTADINCSGKKLTRYCYDSPTIE